MDINPIEKKFRAIENAHSESVQYKAVCYPKWVSKAKTAKQREVLKELYVSLETAVLELASRDENCERRLKKVNKDETIVEVINRLENRIKVDGICSHIDPLYDAIQGVKEIIKRGVGDDGCQRSHFETLHQLALQANRKSALVVTPVDVVEVMVSLTKTDQVHCYEKDGLGLIYGTKTETQTMMVGEEFKQETKDKTREKMKEVTEATLILEYESVVQEMYARLEDYCAPAKIKSPTLLVNASRDGMPFGQKAEPAELNEDGTLNQCLEAGYERVVALVTNDYLTAGKGKAEEILKYCMSKGLKEVIQLPMGLLGMRTQAHSILVFESMLNNGRVLFKDWSSNKLVQPATKGFGVARRAFMMRTNWQELVGQHGVEYEVDIQKHLDKLNKSRPPRKLVSFEVGQFSNRDSFTVLRSEYEFKRINQLMNVFRSHHIEETGSKQRVKFNEVGASSISDYGQIEVSSEEQTCPEESFERRKAQVLKDGDLVVCFRGSSETFGKVGIYKKIKGQIAIPNQSFVILRSKEDHDQNMTNRMMWWWLRSEMAQNYMKQAAITQNVVRISPKKIAEMEIPIGPDEKLQKELERCEKAIQISEEIKRLRNEVLALRSDAWKDLSDT